MAVAGTLEIQLLANIARLQKDMDDAKRSVGGAMATIEKTVGGAVRAMGLLGGALSIGAFVSMAKQAIDTADAINKLTQRTGLAAETLSQLQYAARLADVSSDSLTTGIKKLNQSIAGGLAGDKEKLSIFKSLGITLTDTAGRTKTADQVLLEMADTFAKSRDGAGKTAAAIDLLGKAGDEMIPLLNGGSQAILEMMKEADRLGLTISGDFAARAEEFNDNLTRIQTQSEKLAISLGGDLVDGLGKAMKAMADAVAEGNKLEGVVNFIQTLLTGDDRYKAQVKVVTETEKLMAAQSALDRARGSNNEKEIARLENAVRLRKAELDMHRNYLAMLDAEEKKSKDAAAAAAKIRTSGKEIRTIDSGAAKAAQKELEDQAKLLAELSGLSGSFAEDWARLNTIYAKGAITVDQLTEAQEKLLAQQPAMKKMADERKHELEIGVLRNKQVQERAELEAKLIAELLDSRNRQFDADAKVIKSAEDMVKQAQFELSLMGLSNVEREKAIALRQLEATGIDKATLKYAELAEAMSKTVSDRAAMQKQIDDFQSIWGSIDRTAQQTFTNIFEGGQDAFTKLRDTLKATLLDLLYQMTVRKWVFNLAANVTGASSTAAGAVGQATGINSLSSLGGLGNLAGGGMSMANSLGTSFANITGGGLDALLATNGAFGTAGGAAGGLMSGIGAAAPWVAGALAIASLLDKPGGGPKTIGGASDAATIQATVQATLAQFGIRNAGLRVGGFSAADPQGDALTQLQTALFQGDRALYSRQDRLGGFENVGRSSEELAAAWAEEQSRIMLAALQATLEPKYQQYLAGISADASSLDEVNAALARLTTARTLEERLLELSSTEAENLARARARELDAMDETLRPLMQQIYAQEDLKKAATQATASLQTLRSEAAAYATRLEDDALAALQRALDAQRTTTQAARDAASESVATLRTLFDALGSSARDLYGQVAATRNAAGTQGSAFISQALATARATGYMPNAQQLTQAISAAQAGISGGQFRSVKDREFAQLVLAGQLTQLKDISGDQLTEAERALRAAEDQLRVLERTYDTARAQLDALRGVDSSVLTLAQALAAFQGALQTAGGVRGAAGAGPLSDAAIADWVAPRLGVSEAANRALYNDALANRDRGVTLDKIDAAGGLPPGTSAAWAIANGLTPFAVGTNYVPQDMPAFLHQGEAVVPRAYNPAAGGQAMKTDRLEKLVEDLTREVQRLNVQARRTADATNGSPERPQLVQVV